SWTGLPEFKDDTVTDYSRHAPTVESSPNDAQNRNPSVTETEASPSTNSPKSFIKFLKENDSPTNSKTDKAETAKKPPVKPPMRPMRSNMNGAWPNRTSFNKLGSSQNNFDDKGYWDSGCSRHMTGNISYLSDFKPFDEGYVSFGQGGCKITGKGIIKIEPSLPPQKQQSSPQAPPQDAEFPTQLQQVLNLKARVKKLEKANKLKSLKLRRLRKVGAYRRVESSNDMEVVFNQGRMIADMDMIEGIELVKDAKEDDSEVQEVVEVVTTAKLITKVTAAASQVSAASTTILAASATIPAAKRLHKKEEMKDQEIIKSINETLAQKAAKRRKLSEEAQEAEDLRKRLDVVEDEDDDVFVDATPLASKVLVVDYQIVLIDNKPRFKIIKADETYHFYISFATLLKNFDREDLFSKWKLHSLCSYGDVTRLQALVDKKKIVISEDVICEILQFDSLVRNVDSSSKFYMYRRFIQLIIQAQVVDLSSHTTRFISPALTQKVFANMRTVGKGFSGVETPLFENMLAVRDVDAEAEVQVSAQGKDIQENAAEQVAVNVVQPTPTSPLPSSHVIPSTYPHQSPCPPQPQDAEVEIVKLKARVKKLEKLNKVKSSKLRRLRKVGTSQCVESSDDVENVFNQGRISVDMDQDEGIKPVVLSMQEDDTEVQEAVEIITTAKLMTEVVTAAATQVAAASTPIPAAKPKILKIVAAPLVSTRKRKGVVIRDPEEELHTDTSTETHTMKDKGKGILIEDLKPMKKKDQIEMDAEYARKLQEEINKEHEESFKNIDWNAALDHIQSKEPQYIKRYHGIKKKPQTESKARKNMISYLRNTECYKMEFFKGLKYDDILPIFQARFDANLKFLFKSREEMEKEDEEIIKSINETLAQKAAKRRRLREQAKEDEDLKKQLEVVVNEDDDVFIKATPIRKKVPVVNYEIVMINNKPRYKIIRVDDTHQLYTSFITLLKNFDREDLEDLWKIMNSRFSTSKPTNFFDNYLLSTLKTMFEKTDGQDAL
nr:hypothetical protein [Tanacetum cinerariifolium]